MTKLPILLPALLLAGLPLTAALAQRGVGIGTTNPKAQLHVESSTTSQPHLLLRNPQGGPGAAVNLDFQTYDPSTNPSGARLQAVDNNYSADLLFWTKQPGALTNPLVERLRLTNDGRLGLGTVPDASAVLDLAATNRGVLLPRLLEQARLGLASPAPGLLVFQTDGAQPGFWYNAGTAAAPAWARLTDQDPAPSPWVQGDGTLYPRVLASRVGIGTAAPDAAAALDITSASQGVLLPRFGYAERAALGSSPPVGLIFFNTDANQLNVYAGPGLGWQTLTTTDASTLQYSAPGLHTYTVPAGVKKVHLVVAGAQGGGASGGDGGVLEGDLAVSFGQVLYLLVGGMDGLNGDPNISRSGGLSSDRNGNAAGPYAGNGGGASEVRVGTAGQVPRRSAAVLIAGGGGGSGGSYNTDPNSPKTNTAVAGGRSSGASNLAGNNGQTEDKSVITGGGGATTTQYGSASNGAGSQAGGPADGQGGNAQTSASNLALGVGGGGGGGGYYAGGSGGTFTANSSLSTRYYGSGGGGGSSFIAPASSTSPLSNTSAVDINTGNGYIIITPIR